MSRDSGGEYRTRRQQAQGSRNSSARSSAVYNDDFLQATDPNHASSSRGLRSPASRLSLFATTRKEFDFGFDDGASSYLERSTVASEPASDCNFDDTVVIDPAAFSAASIPSTYSPDQDLYDLLCLPRNPSVQAIRRAYYRLFVLLYPDSHPAKVRHVAERYFAIVQTAFEILIDPGRRLKYDLNPEEYHQSLSYLGDDLEYQEYRLWHAELLRRHFSHLNADEDGNLEIGINAEGLFPRPKAGARRPASLMKPLDFAMGQSFSLPLPKLGNILDQSLHDVQVRVGLKPSADEDIKGEHAYKYGSWPAGPQRTFMTINGSIYGFLQDVLSMPISILADPYQPALANDVPRERAVQIRDGRIIPSVSLRLQHELSDPSHRQDAVLGDTYHPGTIVELESDILPDPMLGFRITRGVVLPKDARPSSVQVATKTSLWHRHMPRLCAVLQRPTRGGLLQVKVDSGDWTTKTDKSCYAFSQFSRINKRFLSLDFPPPIAPRVDVAYKVGSAFKPLVGFLPGRASDRGLRGVDWDMEHDTQGSWTVSTSAEPSCLGSSLRYSIDVDTPSLISQAVTPGVKSDTSSSDRRRGRGVRLEAELSSNTYWTGFVALRCLKRIGRFSKFGFEVGLSSFNLHLSLYWSRMGQRIRLPFLISSGSSLGTRVLFWTTILPMASLAVWELIEHRRRVYLRDIKRQVHDLHKTIQKRRAQADEVQLLMAPNVEGRQAEESRNAGLVILSAKYGVKAADWGEEEVADVKYAVAALVDGGQLLIPHGVRKCNILGFWDPAPLATKALHVRYLWQGREGVVEASGDDELRLPPV